VKHSAGRRPGTVAGSRRADQRTSGRADERGVGGADERGVGGADERTAGRRWLDRLPYLVVLAGAVAGVAVMGGGEREVRQGTLVIAGMLLVAAVARLMLPERRAGMLGSRRRLSDVATLGALGICLLVMGLLIPVTG
jgi:hypothetical protein